MPITSAQLQRRKEHLGSSDMAAVLGLDPRHTPYDIWLQKTGKLIDTDENSDAMYAGTMFENGVLDHAERELGKLARNQYRSAKDRGIPLGANLDAIVVASGLPVEAKTTGLFGPVLEHWGDAGTDEVPERVIIQVHVQMICTLTITAHVPAFIGGRGFVMYQVPYEPTIGEVISETADRFWNKHVLADIPPDNSLPTAKVIKRIRREPESVVDIDYSLIDMWLQAKEIVKAAESEKDRAEAEMLAALGQAEGGATTVGLLTYYAQSRSSVDTKALKAEHPEIYQEYERVSTYRVPRFRKHKN
jgi:putative phage-type endonuclease